MSKFKNYGFWTALSGAVVMSLKTLGDACGFSIPQETVSNLIMAVAEILVVLGIVAMPKNVDDASNKQEKDESDSSKEDTDNEQKEEQETSSEKTEE